MNGLEYISVSEIADYVYCKRGWQVSHQKDQDLSTNPQVEEITDSRSRLSRFLSPHVIAAWLFLISGIVLMLAIIIIRLL